MELKQQLLVLVDTLELIVMQRKNIMAFLGQQEGIWGQQDLTLEVLEVKIELPENR